MGMGMEEQNLATRVSTGAVPGPVVLRREILPSRSDGEVFRSTTSRPARGTPRWQSPCGGLPTPLFPRGSAITAYASGYAA